ncbi:WYL domain-containing protein [Agromyces sp. G08B096]|uniref:WYL domain-containing protein n=1 Tax=Agromyces sp. G08B096 TaxID=3156399 RepID=A0AAU7W5X2_9MICO
MRADRLVATLLLMQARGRVTARELAAELEISVATARRDLEALSGAGVPVYPQPGRGGGWSLLGGGRTDLSGFTAAEARSLFLLLGPRAGDSPEGRSVLRKVLRALPATFRADAEAAAGAVIAEAGGWARRLDVTTATATATVGAGDGAAGAAGARSLAVVQAAVVERRVIRFGYRAWGSESDRERVVRPLGLVDHGGTWYLVADVARADGADLPGDAVAARRTYRLDRMQDVEPLEETFEPPDAFSLEQAWAEASAGIAEARSRARAVVLVDPASADEVRGWLGDAELDGTADDGRVRVIARAPAEAVLATKLAAWAAVAEVVEPDSLRARLAELGEALAARYGTSRG